VHVLHDHNSALDLSWRGCFDTPITSPLPTPLDLDPGHGQLITASNKRETPASSTQIVQWVRFRWTSAKTNDLYVTFTALS